MCKIKYGGACVVGEVSDHCGDELICQEKDGKPVCHKTAGGVCTPTGDTDLLCDINS